jgi:hypothetical protein
MIPEPAPRSTLRLTPRLILGLFLMALGVLFTLGNLHLIDARHYLRFWPVVLIAIGVQKLAAPGGGARWGAWLWIGIGCWLLADHLGLVSIDFWRMWPGLVILVLGAALVYRAVNPRQGPSGISSGISHETVNMFALMAGHVLTNNAKTFRGGDMVAVMGGCELDLRQADMADGEAVIDTLAFMGGIEIKVPEDWTVVCKGFPFMGGFEDTTKPPQGGADKRLIVRGLAFMGGVEVHN